ncbi:MAG TPA: PEP/pyruvate-binding domain-containing protein, partial [Candidatus Limnocylindrales bacterium]|nr:PEP/pyruvate-binding domain-containing protein [Candidatus Limnocylindrales bacterium]
MNDPVPSMARIVDYDRPPDMARSDLPALVGGKAAGLTVMAVDLGLPVPPAFTLTTAVCRDYLANGWPDGLDEEIREHMAQLEKSVGRRFGDRQDPLLVSVRSGSPISMPGMMDTLLNVGSGADPWTELRAAIESVFRSWHSPRATAYRKKEGIADDLGTAATVQAMVFGNRNHRSATGVLFTRNPATGARELYGDVLFNAQGEEVVSGTRDAEPIAVLEQRLPEVAAELAAHSYKIERHLHDAADIEFTIEDARLWMLQCRVGKRSPLAALRMAVEMAEDPGFPLSREEAVARVATILADPPRVADRPRDAGEPLTAGLGASPGVASGEIVTSPDAAVAVADAGRAVILVRRETSPDDVHGMARAAGILTSTGGLACHAAVVARGWGVPAVVGATSLTVEA